MSLRLISRLVVTVLSTTVLSSAALVVAVPAAAETPTPVPTPGSPSPSGSTPSAAPGDTPATGTSTPSTPTASTPSVSPAPTATPEPSSSAPETPSPSTTPSASPTLSATPTRAPGSQLQARANAEGPKTLTLVVTAGGTPQAGRFFEDIGYYAISGVVSDQAPGTRVSVYWYDAGAKVWRNSKNATTAANGTYAVNQTIGHAATIAFRATLGGTPGTSGVISSNEVKVTVQNSYVKQNKPVASIDALKNPTISGSVFPVRAGVAIHIQVRRADKIYRAAVGATTDAAGNYRATLAYGNGKLATYSVRSAYKATNRNRWEITAPNSIRRARVLNAVITRTTAAEVAKTYRSGCPVGPSKLRTIHLNYFGFDKAMHRGVIIVRTNLTGKITRGFTEAMNAGYPIAKMRNPNDYGGNDPRQMEANNTSGFNCRKVVGNPYAQSPHSYGIAIDVNTVQNPYRDSKGKWWPKNGKSYIDRTPRRFGMLTKNSYLTKQLREEGYFWGGFWSPGRDYQHFEYDK